MRRFRATALICTVLLATVGSLTAAEKALDKPAAKPAPAQKPAAEKPPTTPAAVEDFDAGKEGVGKDEGGKDEGAAAHGSSLKIPRFVSLRTSPINLRTGPGTRYPVDWVYVRRSLPVEVIGEFDTWRQIRDPDGAEGWVHQSMLSGRRTAMIKASTATLRHDDNDQSAALATVEKGVVVNVHRCPETSGYCRVEVSGLQGWLERDVMWGVYPTENVQ